MKLKTIVVAVASVPVSTVTGTHLANKKASTPVPNNIYSSSSHSHNNNNNINNAGKTSKDTLNPFLAEPIIAPLATSEVSPGNETHSFN